MPLRQLSIQWKITLLAGLCLLAIVTLLVGASQYQASRSASLVREASSGGVHVVYDGVGGEISTESLRAVRFGARFLIVGWASTPFVARGKGQRGAPNANQLPTNLIMMKSVDVLGCPTAISTAMDPSSRAPRVRQILAWAEARQIVPRVSHTFPLVEFKEAMRTKWGGAVLGGCVLHP